MGSKVAILLKEREPLWLSVSRDTYSFGALGGTAWFLNTQIPPSGWLNAGLAIAWLLWMLGRGTVEKLSPAQARQWLDEHHPVAGNRP